MQEPSPVLYVVHCTRDKIWHGQPGAPPFVPARDAYTDASLAAWYGSRPYREGAPWVFLSGKYGFIEPEHPIGFYDVTFLDPSTGPITDEALRAQAAAQDRLLGGRRVPLRQFTRVVVLGPAIYVEKVRLAFEPLGARVELFA